ncbi:hypothetical protein B296_00008579 [Ensete ventricosum]|uniref:Uncharacterized protein n=1 Tax=Ensete ventricosum TaxID=4639 RepID=A0A426ZM70_ENSVE|nr:hypothetical protein B296_00008579 [Ensete ventricosum]
MAMAASQVRFGVSEADTSGVFPRELLESMPTEKDRHKGLVGMGVPDVTPLTLKSEGGCPYARPYLRCHLGMVELYDESVGVEVWSEGMARHTILMARAPVVMLARRLDASTLDADVAIDLAVELAWT